MISMSDFMGEGEFTYLFLGGENPTALSADLMVLRDDGVGATPQ